MDPFNAFFSQWGGIFQLISLAAAVTALVFYVLNFIKTHERPVMPKAEKLKMPKVKAEKVNRYNLIVKDDHNVIIFNTNYKSKYAARTALKDVVKELVKANKKPNLYKISKIK